MYRSYAWLPRHGHAPAGMTPAIHCSYRDDCLQSKTENRNCFSAMITGNLVEPQAQGAIYTANAIKISHSASLDMSTSGMLRECAMQQTVYREGAILSQREAPRQSSGLDPHCPAPCKPPTMPGRTSGNNGATAAQRILHSGQVEDPMRVWHRAPPGPSIRRPCRCRNTARPGCVQTPAGRRPNAAAERGASLRTGEHRKRLQADRRRV